MAEKTYDKSSKFPANIRGRMSALPQKTDQYYSKERNKSYQLNSPPHVNEKNCDPSSSDKIRQTIFHQRCHDTKDQCPNFYKTANRTTKIPEMIMNKDTMDRKAVKKNKAKVSYCYSQNFRISKKYYFSKF